MPDEQYPLPKTRPPWWRRVPVDRWIAIGSAVLAAGAVVFYALQYQAADAQARIARAGLELAKAAAREQAKDVERSRAAAEKSAAAAELLAEAMKTSAAAALESAQAGRQSLALTRRQLVLGGSPSLFAASIRLTKAPAVKEEPIIVTQIMNNGKGTAYELTTRTWVSLSTTLNLTYEPYVFKNPDSVTQLAPGTAWVETAISGPRSLTDNDIKDVQAGKLVLFVYGIVTYDDHIFEKHRHTLYWCAYYSPSGDSPDKLSLVNCPEHNYTESSQ